MTDDTDKKRADVEKALDEAMIDKELKKESRKRARDLLEWAEENGISLLVLASGRKIGGAVICSHIREKGMEVLRNVARTIYDA